MTTQQATLPWEVFDADGKLRAAFDSETEAYFYLRGRGHVHGGTYRKLDGSPGVFLQREAEKCGDDDEQYPPRCTNPRGHQWDMTDAEADECGGNIRCVYCGADGDA